MISGGTGADLWCEERIQLGKGFALESKINWLEKDGKEYKGISLQYNDWWNWIIPLDYQKAFKYAWFDTMMADKRFDVLFERLYKCVVCREISTN